MAHQGDFGGNPLGHFTPAFPTPATIGGAQASQAPFQANASEPFTSGAGMPWSGHPGGIALAPPAVAPPPQAFLPESHPYWTMAPQAGAPNASPFQHFTAAGAAVQPPARAAAINVNNILASQPFQPNNYTHGWPQPPPFYPAPQPVGNIAAPPVGPNGGYGAMGWAPPIPHPGWPTSCWAPPMQQQPGGDTSWAPPMQQQQPGGGGDTSWAPPMQQQPGGNTNWAPPMQQQPGGDTNWAPPMQQQPGGDTNWAPPMQQQPSEQTMSWAAPAQAQQPGAGGQAMGWVSAEKRPGVPGGSAQAQAQAPEKVMTFEEFLMEAGVLDDGTVDEMLVNDLIKELMGEDRPVESGPVQPDGPPPAAAACSYSGPSRDQEEPASSGRDPEAVAEAKARRSRRMAKRKEAIARARQGN